MRFSLGTYQYPKMPMATPVRHVQIHHRAPVGRLSRIMSRTISVMTHPEVMTPNTSWSFASSGGGGDGRVSFSPGPRVWFTPTGYEVKFRP